ncbi:MAG: hypothetical protein PHP39_10655, partial [Oscillospiraceae bacterium]|nr:hypothetical protein [Oscillospiraceae bacterium]
MIDHNLIEQTHSRAALVLRLTDACTGAGQLAGKVRVFMPGRGLAGVKTASGYYVFSDLPAGIYRVLVQSEYYFDEEREIDTASLAPLNPVVSIDLTPNPGYPFPESATLLRGLVVDQRGPVPGAAVAADIFQPGPEATARVGPPAPEAADMSIRLIDIKTSLQVGERLVIKDANRSRTEFCRIAAPLPANPDHPFHLTKPLKFKHLPDPPLSRLAAYDQVQTRTNAPGEYV